MLKLSLAVILITESVALCAAEICLDSSYQEYAGLTKEHAPAGAFNLSFTSQDQFESSRYIIIANTPIVHARGTQWSCHESHYPQGQAECWSGHTASEDEDGLDNLFVTALAVDTPEVPEVHALIPEPIPVVLLGAGLVVVGISVHRQRRVRKKRW